MNKRIRLRAKSGGRGGVISTIGEEDDDEIDRSLSNHIYYEEYNNTKYLHVERSSIPVLTQPSQKVWRVKNKRAHTHTHTHHGPLNLELKLGWTTEVVLSFRVLPKTIRHIFTTFRYMFLFLLFLKLKPGKTKPSG